MVNLKNELTKRNMTCSELARKIGATRQAVNQIAHGSQPSVDLAKKIAKELNINWWELYK